MRQEFCLNHSSGLNAQNILLRILDQARLTGGLQKPVFLAFLSVALICVSRPRGERHVWRFFLSVYFRLQSTRHKGRDVLLSVKIYRAIPFQSTRPAWGATRSLPPVVRSLHISIHAPAWGATQALLRPPISLIISIHAPAWGATADDLPRADVLAFQSTRPRGARLTMRVTRSGSLAFQSTRPRGARPLPVGVCLHARVISIHAPAWGATAWLDGKFRLAHISIHAPTRGATLPR